MLPLPLPTTVLREKQLLLKFAVTFRSLSIVTNVGFTPLLSVPDQGAQTKPAAG